MVDCTKVLKEKLKAFYKEDELDFKVTEFDTEINSIIKMAKEEGADPVKFLEKKFNENIQEIQMDAHSRMLQVEKYNKSLKQVEQFKNLQEGVESTLHAIPGKRYDATAGNIESNVGSVRRLRTAVLLSGIKDVEGGMDRVLTGEFDSTVMRLVWGEVSEAEMGTLPKEAITIYKALQKHNDLDYKQKIQVGANVKYRKGRVFKQRHSAENMKILGKQEWTKIAAKNFDADNLSEIALAGLKGEKLEAALANPALAMRNYLDDTYDKILAREGKRGMEIQDDFKKVLFTGQKSSLEKSLTFKFKDSISQLEYNRMVNGKSVMSMALEDVRDNSGYIGSAMVYGPNPAATFNKLLQTGPDLNVSRLEGKYKLATGRRAGVASGFAPKAAEKLRKLADMTKLGTAIFSTLPDFSLGAMILSKQTGDNYFSSFSKLMKETYKNVPKQHRREVQQRLSVLTDDMLYGAMNTRIGEGSSNMSTFDDFSMSMTKKAFADKDMKEVGRQAGNAFDATHRKFMTATGLPLQSEIVRTALAKNMAMHMADISKTSYDAIYPDTKDLLRRFSIGEKEWDIMRKNPIDLEDGSKVLDTESLLKLTKQDVGMSNQFQADEYINRLATNYSSMLTFVAEHGSPTPGVKTKHWVDSIDPNTAGGIMARFVGQYKSFSLSVMDTLSEAYGPEWSNNRMLKMSAAAMMGMGLAYMGTSAKNAMLGREPLDPSSSKTWKDMALRAGMGGLYADFMMTDYNSPWRSLGADLAGPAIGTTEDLLKGGRSIYDILMADDSAESSKAKRKLLYSMESLSPSILFTKSLMNKNFYDMLHKTMNTGAKR